MEVILLWILSTFIVSAHGRPFQTIGIATARARESDTIRPRCFWPFTLIPKLFKSQETRDTLGQQEVASQNYGQPSGQVPGMAHPFLANPEVGPVVGRLEPQPPISIGPAPLHYQPSFFGPAVGQMQPLPIGPAPPNYAAAGPYNPQPVRLPGPMLGTPCFMPQQNPLPAGTMWVPCPAALQAMQDQQLLLPQPAPLKRSQRA